MTPDQIMLIISIVASAIFLLQFIIALFVGDVDDENSNGCVADTDLSDVFSFKGLTHFLIGFGWTKVLFEDTDWYVWLIAVLVGIVCSFILFWVYYFAYKLHKVHTHSSQRESAKQHVENIGNGSVLKK